MSELTLALSPCQLPTFFFLPSLPELFDELSSCISPLEVQQDVTHKPELLLCSLLPTLLSENGAARSLMAFSSRFPVKEPLMGLSCNTWVFPTNVLPP